MSATSITIKSISFAWLTLLLGVGLAMAPMAFGQTAQNSPSNGSQTSNAPNVFTPSQVPSGATPMNFGNPGSSSGGNVSINNGPHIKPRVTVQPRPQIQHRAAIKPRP